MEHQGTTVAKGDRVRLRAGGPKMYVIAISENLCYCNWVDELGRIHQGTFDVRTLEAAEAGDSRPAPLA